jgi:leucyl-tRNA synthetase
MFKKIVENGKAEYKDHPVFWCEKLSTVLSNEEIKIIDGKIFSERENFPVIRKNIKQWIIRITDYSKDLVEGLDSLD